MKYQVIYRYKYTHLGIPHTGLNFYNCDTKKQTMKKVKAHLDATFCSQEEPVVLGYRVMEVVPPIPYPTVYE